MAELIEIVDRLQERLGTMAGSPQPLEGGITNRNFRVRFGQRDYVVRLPGRNTGLLGISREAERLANQTAAGLGFAPAVAAGDDRCLVTDFLVCDPVDPDGLRANPEAVAEALRAFHESGADLPARFWVPELLEQYAAIVGERGGELPDAYAPTQELAGRIAEVLPLDRPVPCHDDLLPANLLALAPRGGPSPGSSGPRIVLVDWEYAGMGHHLFDLGNLAVNNEFDAAAEDRLLGAYFGVPATEGRRAALALMRIMSDAREAAWGVVQSVISELDFDFDDYASKHFERLHAKASDPHFDQWLASARA
ncbi:MAG: phosphotransferase [Solirubrobacteraceae bacterium]